MRFLTFSVFILVLGGGLHAQQVPDTTFAFPNDTPAYPTGAGPMVCVDAAHHNFHTLDGRYYAFGKLVRGDGFRTYSITQPLDQNELESCSVVVVANALAAENAVVEGDPEATRQGWEFPHPPALRSNEIRDLLDWVIDGGALLLVMDHSPFPGAVSDLAALLGAVPLNGGATYRLFGEPEATAIQDVAESVGYTPERLRQALGEPGGLGEHPILTGRGGVDDPVRSIMTFGGSAFFPSENMRPLLTLPPEAFGLVSTPSIEQDLWPRFALDGWLAAGAIEMGEGRVVVLGEAATCSAQLSGPNDNPMGMNNPLASDNPRFCLNIVRWLSRIL